jgi:hypothetical protein
MDFSSFSNDTLIHFYQQFIKRDHYEAVDEFEYLKNYEFNRWVLETEILRRMKSGFKGD